MADPFQDIYTTAVECKDLFVQFLSKNTADSEQMIDHQHRFMSWASYLGVFAPVSASLDTRLRDAPEVKELVILLLNVLMRNLKRVLRRTPSTLESQDHATGQVASKPDGALYGIVGAIDRLHRLAAMIRHPLRNEDVDKVLKYSQKQGPDGFDGLIVLIVNFKFPEAPESLRMQLARSIIYRRDRLRYRQSHQSKLATARISSVEPVSSPLPAPVVSSDLPKDAPPIPQPSVSESVAIKSETEPTVFNFTAYLQHQQQSAKPAPSIKSSGSSDRVGEVIYPRPPAVPDKSFHTECQFCSREVTKGEINNSKWWRSHVNADLQPYVCISHNCGSIPPSFSRRRAWFTHMKEHHGSDWAQNIHRDFEYHCPFGHNPTLTFKTEDSLLQHLVSAHSRDVQESERQAIVTRSKAAIPSELALCALCNQDVRSIPTATSSKSTVDDEEEPRRGTPELSKGQDPGKLKGEKEPPITFSETSKKPIPMGASKAGVRFDLPPEHREPHSTATTTEAGPRSDVSVGREDFGSIQAKLHNHLADHLRSLSFLSLRWWDEERNSGSQDSGEARGRGDADSNSSQDLGDSENDDTPTADPKVLADCLKSLAFPEMYNQFSTVAPADDNTCQWLFLHEAWNSWASSDSSLLYIKGKDGSGKSTLLRYALHHISEAPNIQKEAIVLSFFFNRHGTELQRTSLGLFRSLLYQLLCEIPDEMHDLIGIFEDRRKENGEPGVKWHWTVHDLLSFFEAILPDIARSRPVWLFVDDLDESEHETELVQIFKSLLRMPLPFHICITYGPLVRIDSDCEFQIRVEQGNREDISTYVRHRLSEQNFSRLGSLITNEAEGVFLWVVILMEYILELEKRGETPNRIADAIITLPWNLDNLYLQRIRSAAHPASPKLIKWICLATRTLSLRELRWAMLVDSDTPHASLRQCEVAANFPADEVGMTKMIREISGGLVNTVQASHTNPSGVASTQVAQFVHPSIRDFFLGKGLSDLAFKITEAEVNKADFAVEMSQVQLSLTCIRYLAMEEMDWSANRDSAELMSAFPLLHYATTSWVTHARLAEPEKHSQDNILQCLGWPSRHLVDRWVQLYNILDPASPDCPSAGTTMIHVASRYHLPGMLQSILRTADWDETDFDKKDGHGRTPLWWAAEHGDKAVVELLLSTRKINVNRKDDYGQTPLSRASEHGNGNDAVLQLLQDAGATDNTSGGVSNVDAKDWRYTMGFDDYQYYSKMT